MIYKKTYQYRNLHIKLPKYFLTKKRCIKFLNKFFYNKNIIVTVEPEYLSVKDFSKTILITYDDLKFIRKNTKGFR